MKNKHFILLITVGLLCFTTGLFAQEKLTLQEAITIALKNNYDIKLVSNDLAIAHNNVNLGNAGVLPAVTGTFSTGGSRQNSVQTQASGTQRVIDGAISTNMRYGVGLDWTIFDGFKMFATYDKLRALEKQGEVNAKGIILNTIAQVVNAYYDLVKQQQLIIAADSAIDVSALRLKIADNKLQLGRGSKLDVVAAQVDYNTDTSNYLQQQNLGISYMVRLNQLMVRELDTRFSVSNDLAIDQGLIYSTLAGQTEQLNPNLQAALITKKIAELTLKEVKASKYPLIGLNSGYEFNRSTSPTGFNTQFRANGLTYGITASINIFNGFLQRQNERNAKIAINSSELTFDKTKQDLLTQLTIAYQNYNTYIELVKLERKNVELAKQNLSITLDKYRLGSIAPLELREAQRNAINANSRYVEIQYQAKIAEITLKEISGTLNIQ
ncbi:TolC family protein [Pedobacter insulae]|uniref:Outer membrane protein TolC n=1 Tax=Pedobacter insulae TaxID=414048 RepID=A0A1I2ZB33_9SPHI|nr:TolC family protein [Pedobacter insulae]SFH35053.1 Outer membrane protein TolC [Pedobacter insulae]